LQQSWCSMLDSGRWQPYVWLWHTNACRFINAVMPYDCNLHAFWWHKYFNYLNFLHLLLATNL
jgi:hypothetical protein